MREHFIKSSLKVFSSFLLIISLYKVLFTTVILFKVRVPVLSEHITVALPKASTAGSFFTKAFFLAILDTPKAITIVAVAGNPSGITEIAKDIETINKEIKSLPYNNPIINIRIATKIPIILKTSPTLLSFLLSGVSRLSVLSNIVAIEPTSVLVAVPTTTPIAVP